MEVDVNAYASGGLVKPMTSKARIEVKSELHTDIMRWEWGGCESVWLLWDFGECG